jgi:hypothetical protein
MVELAKKFVKKIFDYYNLEEDFDIILELECLVV